ncbi:flavin reductase family protein [Streptomyces polyrhachis]|uniref:Flavin reductase family protein n=1 Tax=Streptomyces polyrhachis TaxID=1282885 RepID=A0ABW2GIR4_9ACTN
MRIDFDPSAMGRDAFYRLLTAVVVPRPIAWVSTVSKEHPDRPNLAPHSFFSVACVEPPIVQFTSVTRKDSLRNVEETGQFVVNFAPEGLFREINDTATDFPAEVSEFDAVGLEPEPSQQVKPPRVAASPAALECVLHSLLTLGDSTVVFGRVVHAVVSDGVLAEDGLPGIGLLRPLTRLGRNEWGTLGGVLDKPRIRWSDWQRGERS